MIPLVKGEKSASGTEYVFIDRMPWWEYVLSKWYLEFQSSAGGQFTPDEESGLKGYQRLLSTEFDKLGYPPGDIAVRSNRWKLILRKYPEVLEQVSWWRFITGNVEKIKEVELYDLLNDPYESRNVAELYPKIASELKERLLVWDRVIEKQRAVIKGDKRFVIPYP
jgi:hypothetical protein